MRSTNEIQIHNRIAGFLYTWLFICNQILVKPLGHGLGVFFNRCLRHIVAIVAMEQRMTDCCEYKCEQGRDCPVRKKRAQETYKEFYEMNLNPYDDVTETIKALIAVIAVTAALTLLAFLIWGK